jgi:transcriptional regulator with XRE-family HTH domain
MSDHRQEVTIVIRQLGQRIRELRRILSLTQEELAARAGISVSFLSMMERGDRVPHIETLAKLADALRVPLPEMFLGLGEAPESSPRLLDSFSSTNLSTPTTSKCCSWSRKRCSRTSVQTPLSEPYALPNPRPLDARAQKSGPEREVPGAADAITDNALVTSAEASAYCGRSRGWHGSARG